MKTTTSLTLALAAMLALGASALADQQPNQQSPKKTKMSGAKASTVSTSKSTTKTWDEQPMPLRAIGYPVVFMERAGHSLIRSPQIVSDTTKGKRDLVSKKGFMTEREMKQTKQTKKTTK